MWPNMVFRRTRERNIEVDLGPHLAQMKGLWRRLSQRGIM
jgi:hypothetical protein